MGTVPRLLGVVRRVRLAGIDLDADLPNQQEATQNACENAQEGMPYLCRQHTCQTNATATTMADRLVSVQPM